MKHDDETPLPLAELRTPHPLRDADFAAIRARVLSELAARQRRPWWAVVGRVVAVIAVVAGIALLSVRRDTVTVPPAPATSATAIAVPAPVMGSAAVPAAGLAASHAATPTATHHGRRVAARPAGGDAGGPSVVVIEPVTRIEIHTADPNVRIIWILDPQQQTPRKEKS